MKNQKLVVAFLTASTALFFTSCKKDVADNQSGIKYKIQTVNRTSAVGRMLGGNIQWTSGYGYATEIKFEAETDNSKVEYKSQVPQRIDLFSGIVNLGNIIIPPGTYKEIDFEVELNSSGANAALELNGQFNNGSSTTPIILRVNNEFEIETEKSNVVITTNNSYSAITNLNLSLLTSGITEAMLNNADRTNGTIVISSSSNVILYNIILNNLRDCDGVEFEDD